MLKRWKQDCRERAGGRCGEASRTFISLPVVEPWPEASSELSKSSLKITRSVGDGVSISIEATLSLAQWRCALSLLAEGERIE